jgi:hypothetical protein
LVQQRLKNVMVTAIHHGYLDGRVGQRLGRSQAGESAADDEDTR